VPEPDPQPEAQAEIEPADEDQQPEPTGLLETVAAAIAGLSELPPQEDAEPALESPLAEDVPDAAVHPEPGEEQPYDESSHPEPSYPEPSYPEPSYPDPELDEPELTPARNAALLPPDLQMVHHGAPEDEVARPTQPEPSYPEPSYPEPSYPEPSYPEPAYAPPGYAQPVYPEPDDQSATTDHASAATAAALLTEFSATSASEPLIPAPAGPDPLEFSAPAADEEPEPEPPTPVRDITDTAALLRELSSLGFDDEPTPSARPLGSPSRGMAASTASKKRKGLFGRG
jgi:hypothetical protein